VTVIATTEEVPPAPDMPHALNNIVVYLDDGNPDPMGKVIATALPNTAFRGVAISPQ
jgi:hypothetical protein